MKFGFGEFLLICAFLMLIVVAIVGISMLVSQPSIATLGAAIACIALAVCLPIAYWKLIIKPKGKSEVTT